MAVKVWTLTDVERDVYEDEIALGPKDVDGGSAGWSVKKRTLRGGLRDGVSIIEVDNGALRFWLLPDRGMGIWRAWHGETELGWKSPRKGPVNPKFVNLAEPGGLGWLSGFDELLCRCGLESNGAPDVNEDGKLVYPLHGSIANLPAHHVELSVDGGSGEISVTGIVDEARLYHNKMRLKSTVTTTVGHPGLWILDEVTNLSAEPGELQLLYHINFGLPLLDPGSKVVAPLKTLVPRDERAAKSSAKWSEYGNEEPGFTEQVYFMDLAGDEDGNTQTLLRNAHGNQGVSLQFNKKQLPCFTLWKSTQAAADGYVTGLEPGINFPNPKSFEKEQGRVAQLKGGATLKFEVGIEFHPDEDSVSQAEQAIDRIQGETKPRVFDRPVARWTRVES
jgi:galactose mutarotase-like enzyme